MADWIERADGSSVDLADRKTPVVLDTGDTLHASDGSWFRNTGLGRVTYDPATRSFEMGAELQRELEIARTVARQAGELVRKHVICEFMSPQERAILNAALSYPEVPHG